MNIYRLKALRVNTSISLALNTGYLTTRPLTDPVSRADVPKLQSPVHMK